MSDAITPFTVEIQDAQVEDLRRRLAATRWPDAETTGDWNQGIPLAYMKEVCAYWASQYDMQRVATRLNALPQFRTAIDGLRIHFLHVRSPQPDALPLVITHGWPGSVVEFLKVIGPLTDPARHGDDARDAFHVVCPSLPGYGFSDKPHEPGWDAPRIGRAWGKRFPDYNRVIPATQSKRLKVQRTSFRETLNRAAILSNEKYRGVRFGLGISLMTITAHNPEQEEAQEEVAIDYSGENMEIGFNVNYISEAVGALDNDEIEFCLNDPNSSCLLRVPGNTKHLYVVMPMRL